MANKYMNRCSTLFLNREIQIKPTMRYHFISTRMATKRQIITSVDKGVDKLESFIYIANENVIWYGHLEKFGGYSIS